MTNNRIYTRCAIFALVLLVGLGLALLLPWMASSQGLAAQNEIPPQNNAPETTPYYVAITGTGLGGLTWTNAFTNVQDALAVAANPSEIWVAKGVYYPDEGIGQINDSVTATFLLTDGVAIFGGFKFNDANFNDRDWENNLTVLSGDVDGDDTSGADGVSVTVTEIVDDNAYHVVTAKGVTGTAVLDGFTITAGQADGSEPNDYGGGFYCDGIGGICNPSLKNVIFSGNFAEYGGAMFNIGRKGDSSPSLKNVTFSGNLADYGGAMYNDGYNGHSSPSLENVIFSGNSAVEYGGAMYNYGQKNGNSSPSLINVTFSGNSSYQGGGAMYNDGEYTGSNSSPSLINVTFLGNSGGQGGGAMYNDGYDDGNSSPSLINVVFSGNSAEDGGGMYNYGNKGTSSPTMTNVTFSGNSASDKGGAIYNYGREGISSPDVRNSIFWNNQASNFTGTISATIYNSNATITLTHSLVEDSFPGGNWIGGSYANGGGNIDEDPMFVLPVDPSTAPTTSGNLRLKFDSPAIDKGDNLFVTVATDLDGEARIQDGIGDGNPVVDMGAYEAPTVYLLTVTKSGTGDGKVTSSPVLIDCGNFCEAVLVKNTSISLLPAADGDSIFVGWSGDCTGVGDCVLKMDDHKNVTARFEKAKKVYLPITMR